MTWKLYPLQPTPLNPLYPHLFFKRVFGQFLESQYFTEYNIS